MLWLAQLLAPMLMVLAVALTSDVSTDLSSWMGSNYLMFALPQLVWGFTALQLGLSKAKTHGGFFGAHILLIAISVVVFRSSAPEAANGWLLFWFGSPAAIALGMFIGGWVDRRASRVT